MYSKTSYHPTTAASSSWTSRSRRTSAARASASCRRRSAAASAACVLFMTLIASMRIASAASRRVDGVWGRSRRWRMGGSQRLPTRPRRCGGAAVPISRCRTRHAIAATLAKGTRRRTKSQPSPPRQTWRAKATAADARRGRRRRLIKEPREAPRQRTKRRSEKKDRTPPNGQVQLRPRLEKTKRVVHDDVGRSHPDERRDGGDLGRREHRRRGSSGAEPGGVIGRNAHGPRLLQSCPRPVPHDCFALLRARLRVGCASMASTRSVRIRADEFRGCSCEIYELSL